jgi:hypothetical protein
VRTVVTQPNEMMERVFGDPRGGKFGLPPVGEIRTTRAFFSGGVMEVADDRDTKGPGHRNDYFSASSESRSRR